MKPLIIVLALLLAGTAWGQDVITLPAPPPKQLFDLDGTVIIPGYSIVTDNPSNTRTNLIRQWAADGSICKVLGHQWQDASEWFRFDKYDGKFLLWDQQKRKCSICNRTETKKDVWE